MDASLVPRPTLVRLHESHKSCRPGNEARWMHAVDYWESNEHFPQQMVENLIRTFRPTAMENVQYPKVAILMSFYDIMSNSLFFF